MKLIAAVPTAIVTLKFFTPAPLALIIAMLTNRLVPFEQKNQQDLVNLSEQFQRHVVGGLLAKDLPLCHRGLPAVMVIYLSECWIAPCKKPEMRWPTIPALLPKGRPLFIAAPVDALLLPAGARS